VQADLLACPSILLSPHMAAKTPGALRRTDEVFWDNLDRFFQGDPPRHAVLVPEGS
jgi:phosphoglycerate dehydrogenase-like enzyme